MRRCQECGTEVEKDDTYCPECGVKIQAAGETRKITAWSVIKTIGILFLFILLIHALKNQIGALALPLLIIFIFLGLGLLNWVLKKIFNAELSTGVKIIITAVLILLLVAGIRQTSVSKPQMIIAEKPEFRFTDSADLYSFVEKINKVINSKDYNQLNAMLERNMVSHEVFEDMLKLFKKESEFKVSLEPLEQNVFGDQAQLKVMIIVRTNYAQGKTGTEFFFETTGDGWRLYAIKPRLSEIKLQKTFEEEASYKIEQIQKPISSISEGTTSDKKDCKSHGEIPDYTYPGDDLNVQCCPGLVARLQIKYFDKNCVNLFEKYGSSGYGGICISCGDNQCDKTYENWCNCPEDCK